jgi:mannan endo-1,4-beta-mannosidase
MIFRPYHEFDGDWFWWGKGHTSREDFIAVWRFTVSYLRDQLGVHNFLYAFSPDNKFNSEYEFLERYPGNEWVDMVGMDNYGDFGRDGKYNLEAGLKKLEIVSEYAQKAGKLAAFTETGLESIPNPTWWTETLLKNIEGPETATGVCAGLAERFQKSHALLRPIPRPGQRSRFCKVLP